MSLKSFLRSFPLFAPLSESDYDLLLTDIQETPYQKGEYIFREGDPTEWFHIVKEGTVKCVKSSPDGRDMTLKICELKLISSIFQHNNNRKALSLPDCSSYYWVKHLPSRYVFLLEIYSTPIHQA